MKVIYDANNSGGGWWLKDEHWTALEAAGWKVRWVRDEPEGTLLRSAGDRWLGALAKSAEIEADSIADAIRAWEKAVGMDASEEGCNCCGAPHSFHTKDYKDHVSGAEVVERLYPGAPKTLREAAERMRSGQ